MTAILAEGRGGGAGGEVAFLREPPITITQLAISFNHLVHCLLVITPYRLHNRYYHTEVCS